MYNGILELPNNDLNNLVQWNRNNKAYETSLSIDLSDISTNSGLLQLEPNQNKVLKQETEQFEIYDYEKDDDLDIREKPTNSPLNTKSTRLITLKNGTRDIIEDDPTYRNIGSFSVTAPLLSSAAISKNQSQFNISDYNQNNNTNYLGVKSVVLTAPEYTACDLFIPTQTTNENMDQNNHLITSNPSWDVYTQNGTSNLWKLFDPTNTDYVSTFWHDNQYLNVHFTGTGIPLVPNKLIYKYNKIGPNDDNNRWHRYYIVLLGSDNNVDWTTLLDINFDSDPMVGDRQYYNENANQIEIPINNYHGYTYYQFKTMAWDNWDNQFNYWNLLNCHSEQETPTTINNYDEYTVSNPLQINSTGTGTISIPNGYTGLGNVNYNVNVPTVNNYTGYTTSSPLQINSTGTGTITIPQGYTGLGNVNYNVNINSKIRINKFSYSSSLEPPENIYNLSSFTLSNRTQTISVPSQSTFILIQTRNLTTSFPYYKIKCLSNNTSSPIGINANSEDRYILINEISPYIFFYSNDDPVLIISDYKNDEYHSENYLYKSHFFLNYN